MLTVSRFFSFLTLSLLTIATVAQKSKDPVTVPEFPQGEDGKVLYSQVITQAGSPDELHQRAMRWFNKFYKSPSSVIRENEPAKISGGTQFRLKVYNPKTKQETTGGIMLYKISIDLKDGKYRLKIYDIKEKANPIVPIEKMIAANSDGNYDDRTARYLVQADAYFKDLIKQLKAEMASDGKAPADDW